MSLAAGRKPRTAIRGWGAASIAFANTARQKDANTAIDASGDLRLDCD
jgi:hypothetical protein